MRQRLLASLVVVAIFAALPAWFLSTREGWIAIECARANGGAALACRVHERFAFGARDATYPTLGAHLERTVQHDRRGATATYQLVLVTSDGERAVLRANTGNAALAQTAAELDAAAHANAAEFHAALAPDLVFWLAVALVAVFAGAGLLIAVMRGARGRRAGRDQPGRGPGHAPATPADPPQARVVRDPHAR
jgi:hypothetical protein